MTDELSTFSLGILDQIRLRKLDCSKVNTPIAYALETGGLISAVEGKTNDAADAVARRTGHFRWRITDAGLARLGKERVW
jgi:hypothetical protein